MRIKSIPQTNTTHNYKSLAETCVQRGDGVAAKGLEAFAGGLVMAVSACNASNG
jgi:hypothetical protein